MVRFRELMVLTMLVEESITVVNWMSDGRFCWMPTIAVLTSLMTWTVL